MRRKFDVPQDAFDGMPEPPVAVLPVVGEVEQRFNPNQRRAFGSVPKLLGGTALEGIDYRTLPPDIIMEVGAGSLRADLTPAPQPGKKDEDKYIVAGLALNATEFKTIVRAREPATVQIAAEATTEAANQGLVNPLRMEEKRLKTRREVLKSKGVRHSQMLKTLESEAENLNELQRLTASPGYALTTELDIRDRATKAWELSFKNILVVVGRQRGWDADKLAAAEETMASRLFTGPQRDRIQYWREMVGLARDYNRMKHALFSQRKQKIVTGYLESVKDLAEFYAINQLQPSA